MSNFEPTIRNAAHALIIHDQRILLLRKGGDQRGERYALPGGAQDPGETLEQALQRECLEEIDVQVEILGLAYVADYFKQREKPNPLMRHQIEFLFSCSVPDNYQPHNGPHPDGHQIEVLWKNLSELPGLPLLPKAIAPLLTRADKPTSVYQGLIS